MISKHFMLQKQNFQKLHAADFIWTKLTNFKLSKYFLLLLEMLYMFYIHNSKAFRQKTIQFRVEIIEHRKV